MTPPSALPVIFLAFANDRTDGIRYLRNLPEELRQVRSRLERTRRCEVVVRPNATLREVLDVFQDERYRDRISIFHFGGHAGGYQLLMENSVGEPDVAFAAGFAEFLCAQPALKLVFLNGCSTVGQVGSLVSKGIPVAIATSDAIDDKIATEFASRFYGGLSIGQGIQDAFESAAAAVKSIAGSQPRAMRRSSAEHYDSWPWEVHVSDRSPAAASWSLPRVDVSHENTALKFLDERVFSRIGWSVTQGLSATSAVLLLVLLGIFWKGFLQLSEMSQTIASVDSSGSYIPDRMTGDFRIAVAGFDVVGDQSALGEEFAQGIFATLNKDVSELEAGKQVWGPEWVGTIGGATETERAGNGEKRLQAIEASVIVYGVVDTRGDMIIVRPEVFINAADFESAEEVGGHHQMSIIKFSEMNGIDRRRLSTFGSEPAVAYAMLFDGLYAYLDGDFDEAVEKFGSILDLGSSAVGEPVLNLLLGNAEGRRGSLTLAAEYYKKAIEADPSYARAYVGLGNVYNSLALVNYSGAPNSIDTSLLQLAIGSFNDARMANNVPLFAQIPEKISLGLGRAYQMLDLSGATEYRDRADSLLGAVAAFETSDDPKLVELAEDALFRLAVDSIRSQTVSEIPPSVISRRREFSAPAQLPGSISVSNSTTGSNIPTPRYYAVLDNLQMPLQVNGTITFKSLAARTHTITLRGVDSNCSVAGGITRTVSLQSGEAELVEFAIICE